MLGRVRLLPVTIFAAALLLTVKIGHLWTGWDRPPVAVATATAQAQQGQQAQPAQAQPAQAGGPASRPDNAERPRSADEPLDPVLFRPSEIELLQDLANRRRVLESREAALVQKEGLLQAAEQRIDQKIAELKTIKGEIQALIRTYEEQEERQIRSIVKIYETMKPKEAASIFDDLDQKILLEVLMRMKEAKTAPILASMRREKAQEVTEKLAQRREMPSLN
ncbi:MAG: hypothetical protein OHK0024_36280 [Thalassobaculales bacterium]